MIQSIATVSFILFPLSLKRDMSAFRYVSMASIGAVFYTAIVIIYFIPDKYNANIKKPDYEVKWAYFDLDMFTGFSIFLYKFEFSVNLFPIIAELDHRNYRRATKVIDRALSVDFTSFAIIGLAGYFSQLNHTTKIVFD